jgi:preprotein translocase subunit SecE
MTDELEVSEGLVEKAKADLAKRGFFGRIALFFRQVWAELKKVTKPTFAELRNYTGVVLGFVVVSMLILSGLDWAFAQLVIFAFSPTP